MNIQEFYGLLEDHDWTFEYSDDHSVWGRGCAEERKIYDAMENNESFKTLYNEYKAFGFGKGEKPSKPTKE